MRLSTVFRSSSPDTLKCTRATGVIVLDSGEELCLWVDVPDEYAGSFTATGNPWVVAMLPIAASRGESIELALPVDALLLENLKGVLTIWCEWFSDLHSVQILCPIASAGKVSKSGRTAAFFSGGIDSYFTVARRMPGNEYGLPVVGQVDDLLTVWGFDVGVYDVDQFGPMAAMLSNAADHLGLNHIVVRTNLRKLDPVYERRWGPLTSGLGLAFVGLMLEGRLSELLVGSSYQFGTLFPWGSHPMLDPLFSTSALTVLHDGASFTRIGKTEIVAKLPVAGRDLHVCQAVGAHNCSRCEKCYRTMIAIDILGQRSKFTEAFDWSGYCLEDIKSIYMGVGTGQNFYLEMVDMANACGRVDMVKALRYAARRSRLLAPIVACANWLSRVPFLWRVGGILRSVALARSVSARYIEHPGRPAAAVQVQQH